MFLLPIPGGGVMILHTEVTIVINNSIFHSISWTNSDNGVGLQIHQPNRVTSARGKMPGIPSGIFTKGCTSWNAGGGVLRQNK